MTQDLYHQQFGLLGARRGPISDYYALVGSLTVCLSLLDTCGNGSFGRWETSRLRSIFRASPKDMILYKDFGGDNNVVPIKDTMSVFDSCGPNTLGFDCSLAELPDMHGLSTLPARWASDHSDNAGMWSPT